MPSKGNSLGFPKGSSLFDHGEHFKVRPIAGYTHSLLTNLVLNREMANRGLYTARFETNTDCMVMVNAAICNRPAGDANYLRLLSVEWKVHQQRKPDAGLALEGDPLSINAVQTAGMIVRTQFEPGDRSRFEKSANLLSATIAGLTEFGAINGNDVNIGKLAKFFQSGLLTRIAETTLNGVSPTEAIALCNPNSIELVDDLNFEIALGISVENQATLMDNSREGQDRAAELILHDLLQARHFSMLYELGYGPLVEEILAFLPNVVGHTPKRGRVMLGTAGRLPNFHDTGDPSDRIGHETVLFQPGEAVPISGFDYLNPYRFRFAGAFFCFPELGNHFEWHLKLIKLKTRRRIDGRLMFCPGVPDQT